MYCLLKPTLYWFSKETKHSLLCYFMFGDENYFISDKQCHKTACLSIFVSQIPGWEKLVINPRHTLSNSISRCLFVVSSVDPFSDKSFICSQALLSSDSSWTVLFSRLPRILLSNSNAVDAFVPVWLAFVSSARRPISSYIADIDGITSLSEEVSITEITTRLVSYFPLHNNHSFGSQSRTKVYP